MRHFFIKKALWGLVVLMLLASVFIQPGSVNNVDAEGGYLVYMPVVFQPAAPANGEIFGASANWKYFDKGTNPGSGWNAPGFNDSAWAEGPAPLGYGESGLKTVVGFGSNSANKYPTTYFRRTLAVSGAASVTSLTISLQRDDGAIVFLNGKEVARANMPSGTVSNTTMASSCSLATETYNLNPADLVEGNNTFAVEVHQCTADSSDLLFSMALNAALSAPQPTATPVAPPTSPTPRPTMPPTTGKVYYVATNGSSSNDGSASKPWSLQHAFNHPSGLRPGDTILVRGGKYTSGKYALRIKGSSSAPITVRAYPGERVTLEGTTSYTVDIEESYYVNLWGMEITQTFSKRSLSRSESTYGVRVNQGMSSHHIKFINMVFHDNQSQGIGWWQALKDSEIYGSLFYYNGVNQLDHGIYANSKDGKKWFIDNIVSDNASHGFHAYASQSEKGLEYFWLEGNTFFNNGSIGWTENKAQYGIYKRNILVGGTYHRAVSPVISNNYTYYPGSIGVSMDIGYKAGSTNGKVTNNYFMGGNVTVGGSTSGLTMTGNTVYSPGGLTGFSKSSYPNNTWLSSKPTGQKVFIRPNKYEPGRANITIYNWSKSGSVSISSGSLQGVALKAGDRYELRNAQNYYGDVITGVYNGSAISVPMTGRSVAQPVGLSFKPASTFPEFGSFVLIVLGQ